MDLYRNNISDLQIIYNDLDYVSCISKFNNNKIKLIWSFIENLKNCEQSFKNFKNSLLFDESINVKSLDFKNRYIIEIYKEWGLLCKKLLYVSYKPMSIQRTIIALLVF